MTASSAEFSKVVNILDCSRPCGDSSKALRVLIVEDEPIIALDLRECVESIGGSVVGAASTVEQAIKLIEADGGSANTALLDVTLSRGETVFPLASYLRERGIGFVFLTGLSSKHTFPEEFKDSPVIEKPFTWASVEQVLRQLAPRQGSSA